MWLSDLINSFFSNKNVTPSIQTNPVVTIQTSNTEIPITVEPIGLDLAKVSYKESPNKSERKDIVRGIVLHHTGPGGFDGIVAWLINPDAKAAAHYVIGTKGELTQLVNTQKNAWHAGTSKFLLDGQVRDNLNHCTIGIEICNAGVLHKGEDGKFYYEAGRDMREWKGQAPIEGSIVYPSGQTVTGYYPPYPKVQIDKVIELCKALVLKYPQIGREDILTHYGIATPEGRKNDPFGLDIKDIVNKIFGGL